MHDCIPVQVGMFASARHPPGSGGGGGAGNSSSVVTHSSPYLWPDLNLLFFRGVSPEMGGAQACGAPAVARVCVHSSTASIVSEGDCPTNSLRQEERKESGRIAAKASDSRAKLTRGSNIKHGGVRDKRRAFILFVFLYHFMTRTLTGALACQLLPPSGLLPLA